MVQGKKIKLYGSKREEAIERNYYFRLGCYFPGDSCKILRLLSFESAEEKWDDEVSFNGH